MNNYIDKKNCTWFKKKSPRQKIDKVDTLANEIVAKLSLSFNN